MSDASTLGRQEIDALQEMASIGCGQALAALSRLAHPRVDMDVPEVWVGRGTGAIADFLGAMGRTLVAVAVRLEGLLEASWCWCCRRPRPSSWRRAWASRSRREGAGGRSRRAP